MKIKSLSNSIFTGILILLIVVIFAGCSGSDTPVETDLSGGNVGYSGQSDNRYFWGLWDIGLSEDHSSAEVIPLRTGTMHLNAVKLLEVLPCTTCLKVDNLVPYPDNRISVDLTLIHPFPGNAKLTGFDVRGIFITGANYEFPESGRRIAWGDGLPRLLLPNGYTTLFNPLEFGYQQPGPDILKYFEGKFSNGGSLGSTLNGYVSYRKEAPRCMFEAGGMETRTVWIGLPDGPMKFGYAVDCSWLAVDGQVLDPVNDFPPDANCLEAYRVEVQVGSGMEPVQGSTQPVEIRVFDHQGLETIDSVTIEAPDLFAGKIELEYTEDVGIESHLFSGTLPNTYGAPMGTYPMLIHVVDTEPDQFLGQVDAWFVYEVEVGQRDGWVRTWGGDAYAMGVHDHAYSVAVDQEGYIYVTGEFRGTVDLDPTDGEEIHYATKGAAYLTKFSPDGDFIWTREWDGQGSDEGTHVAVDQNGDILLLGLFNELIDLDPGPLCDAYEGYSFLVKLNSDGEYIYGMAWDLRYTKRGLCLDASGNCYFCGYFFKTEDFDPGEGEDIHTAIGNQDVFIIKVSNTGQYLWALTWGGPGNQWTDDDRLYAMACDSNGNICVAGRFSLQADYDPGPGVDVRDPGRFLSRFDKDGNYNGTVIWDANTYAIGVDESDYAYVAGEIGNNGVVDMDPGPGVNEAYGPCAFLVRYSPSGDYCWCRTWGFGLADPTSIAASGSGEIYVIGEFTWDLVDFDPSDNNDYHGSLGEEDVFVCKYLATGEYQWTRTWGGTGAEFATDVTTDEAGNVYGVGEFKDEVDFDPGPGVLYIEGHGGGDAYLIKLPPNGNW